MLGPALILAGSYLAVSSGVDIFFYPKLLAISVGCFLCLQAPPKPAPLRPWFLLCLAVTLLATLTAASPLQAALGLFRSPTAGLLGAVACWLSYEAGCRSPRASWRYATWGAGLCAAGALATWIPGAPFHYMLPSGRAIGSIGSPPFLGCMLVATLPWVILSAPRAVIMLVAVALLATESKAAILGAVAGVLVLKAHILSRRATLALGAAGLSGAFLVFSRAGSDTMRLCTWGIAWKASLMRPWFGWGPDNFIDAFMQLRGTAWVEAAGGQGMTASENAHNIVLNLMVTQGILGLCAHMALAVAAGRRLLSRTDRESRCLVACYASVLVYSMCNPTPFMAWSVLAFMLGTLE